MSAVMSGMPDQRGVARAEIVIDLAAIRDNVRILREIASPAAMMTVVKADGYGHGMVEVAGAAREAGAEWIGVATLDEALGLRAAGDTGRLMCWLAVPGEGYASALAADVDVAAYSVAQLEEIVAAGRGRVHLKVDTGLSRGGAPRVEWERLFARAAQLQRDGLVEIVGLWTHPAAADDPAHPANDAQEAEFRDAIALAEAAGLAPEVCHFANSASTILRPSSRFNLVRCGIASYGLDPAPGHTPELGLVPAMTARARLAMVKPIDAGAGVSYGHMWVAEADTTLGLVPVGYADGIPRHASNRAEVAIDGQRLPMRGRVCMDQFLVELAATPADPGDTVVLFGTGAAGEPTAQDWAIAADTINYEIVTRIGGRFVRRHINGDSASGEER